MKKKWWGDAPKGSTIFFDRQCLYGKYEGDQLMIFSVIREEWAPLKNIRSGSWSKSIRPSPCVHCGNVQDSIQEKSDHEKKCKASIEANSWGDQKPYNWLDKNPYGAK